MGLQRVLWTGWTALGVGLSGVACSDNDGDGGFDTTPDRVVSVGVYLDKDGSESPDITEAVPAARIALLAQLVDDTLKSTSTQTTGGNKGIGVFHEIAVGNYRVTVAASTLGDSLEIQAMELRQLGGDGWEPGVIVDDFAVAHSDDIIYVNLRLGYTAAASAAARVELPGRMMGPSPSRPTQ